MATARKILKRVFWTLVILISVIGLALLLFFTFIDIFGEDSGSKNSKPDLIDKAVKDTAMIRAALPDHDSSIQIIRVSNEMELGIPYGIDENAGKVKRIFSGRRINIAVIGVDSRLGSSFKHADANHVVSILVDEGKIEITSIPRDTYCDAMQDDSTQNKLTVLYPARGRQAYFNQVAKIAELDKIHYFIEVGFSQARGILELLGYDNSGSALQVLRSRTALGGNDYQRCYNQAQFIRQMLLKHFDKLTGFFSGILLRGGLAIMETNINYTVADDILKRLKNSGFPRSGDDIVIRIRPPLVMNYKIYDLSDNNIMSELSGKIESWNSHSSSSFVGNGHNPNRVNNLLWRKINTALKDSASHPDKVINNLKTLFNQRAWLQVEDVSERDKIREEFSVLLFSAYTKKKQPAKAEEVKNIIEAEKKLFSVPIMGNQK